MTILVGIGGGTGSGKDTLAGLIQKYLTLWGVPIKIFSTDDCYEDLSYLPLEKRNALTLNREFNYDHPNVINFPKLVELAMRMKEGEGIEYKVYDFTTHSYGNEKKTVPEKQGVVIIQGIYALYSGNEVGSNPNALLNLYDYKLFVDTPIEIAFLRRIHRDINERGRSLEGVIAQLRLTVRPMYEKYIGPTRINADDIISWMTDEDVKEETIKKRLLRLARQKSIHIYERVMAENGKESLLPELSIDEVDIAPLLNEEEIHSLEQAKIRT